MLILSSLFLKLFYAADENKYNDLIEECLTRRYKYFCYTLFLLKQNVMDLSQKKENYMIQEYSRNFYELYQKTSSNFSKISGFSEADLKEEAIEMKNSFIDYSNIDYSKENKENEETLNQEKIMKMKDAILTLEGSNLKDIYGLLSFFFHNVYLQSTYKEFFADDSEKAPAYYLERIYAFLKYYFEDYKVFLEKIGCAATAEYKTLNEAMTQFYNSAPRSNEKKIKMR